MKDYSVVLFVDARVGIGGQRKTEIRQECRPEVPLCLEARAELGVERPPMHDGWLLQDVEPIRQPDVEIERHAVVLYVF